ncbi:DUF2637 domain-containing protein [Streptomyces sp. JV185]|uniref:DUF2637 domain-containing protein n=1 Tax=Streptomyces sp. JV185 TaxID=858638 RepID=UPI002E76D1B8|nr:DUF2637 domain-containing protein [Streptomyces sp. JV185]MEE1768047.1 DUF2637 domain-containing protein [Streptomyces sp. JV185]
MQLTRTHRILIGLVVAGAVLIAGIGFAGSYAAVRELALQKGFGDFSLVFPIGIDAGICVLLALDLLLTWLRIPFPLLRQTAWLLTAATIAFNGAAAWPDPLGVGMHAVIPVLFVVSVEAARHAVGRIADITADKHMEGVRLTRWLLSPVPTFRLWRRMKLWELRSYEQVIKLEQDRLIYQARLQARFGRNWRRKAPVESLMPLRLAKYGVPLAETAGAGLAAAGIEPALLPPAPALAQAEPADSQPELPYATEQHGHHPQDGYLQQDEHLQQPHAPQPQPQYQQQHAHPSDAGPGAASAEEWPQEGPGSHESPWFAAPQVPEDAYESAYNPTYVEGLEPTPVMVPSGPGGRTRPLGNVGTIGAVPGPRTPSQEQPQFHEQQQLQAQAQEQIQEPEPAPAPEPAPEPDEWAQEDAEFTAIAYEVFAAFVNQHNDYPSVDALDIHVTDGHNVRHPRSAALIRRFMPEFKNRYHAELEADHIA